MTGRALADGLAVITFDFGNTLVPFPARPASDVLWLTATEVEPLLGLDAAEFARAWDEERARQFAFDVPAGREADTEIRARRVVARLRGCPCPPPGVDWDGGLAEAFADPVEVAAVVESYCGQFVAHTPVPSGIGPMLGRLAGQVRLGLISNWPLASAIDRYLEAAGWSRHFDAVVVSQRVGAIKPDRRIFDAAVRAIGVPGGHRYLHIGDDLGADVAGAHRVGWRAGLVRLRPEGSPLPVAPDAPGEEPDLTIESVLELEAALGLREGSAAP